MENMKYCKQCEEFKPIEEFQKQGKYYTLLCKICISEKYHQDKKEKIENFENEEMVLMFPNTYKSEIQKKQTFEFLSMLGWIYSEKNNLFYKPGIKDENGIFEFQKKNGYVVSREKKKDYRKKEISEYNQKYREKQKQKLNK